VLNPATNRMVKKDGAIGRKIMAAKGKGKAKAKAKAAPAKAKAKAKPKKLRNFQKMASEGDNAMLYGDRGKKNPKFNAKKDKIQTKAFLEMANAKTPEEYKRLKKIALDSVYM